MRKVSTLWWLLGGFVLVVVWAEMLIYGANLRTRHQAEALLRDVRNIRVGESTSADVLRILQHYPAALPGSVSSCAADESHSIRIANDIINRFGFAAPVLRILGTRPSGVVAMFLLKKGQVCYLSYAFSAGVSDLDLEAEATERFFDCDLNTTGYSREACYSVYTGASRLNRRLTAELSNLANAKERHHAFDFDLSCLTSIRGCQHLCEMNPSLWKDYLARVRSEGWTLPPETNDPRCLAVERSTP